MFISSYDWKGIIYQEHVPLGQEASAAYSFVLREGCGIVFAALGQNITRKGPASVARQYVVS